MKKTNLKVIFVVLILIALTGIAFLSLRHYNGIFLDESMISIPETQAKINPEIVKIADDYIISRVGLDYFRKNYIHLQNADKITVYPGYYTDYDIYYEYIPASKISGEKQLLMAQIRNDKFSYMNGVYNCLKEGYLCDLKVDKQMALEKVKDKGFLDNNQDYSIKLLHSFGKTNGWYWKITRGVENSKPSDCFKSLEIEINASTGETSKIAEVEACI